MRPFLWRFLDSHNDKIAAGPLRNDMSGGEVAFFPAIRLFRQLSFRIVNVDGNLGSFYFGSHPKPVFVSFEKLLPHRLLLPHSKVASPIVFPDLEPFFDVWFGRLQGKRLSVVDGGTRPAESDKKEADK